MPRGILFHGRERECFIRTSDAALILSELRRTTFEAGDPAATAADAISDGFATGDVGPLPEHEVAALRAVLLRLATMHPDEEGITTLHDALLLDYGEI